MDRASASVAVNIGFDSESGQTNDLNIDIHSFPRLTFGLERDGVEIQQQQQPSFFLMITFFYDSTL